jgi:signal transduction histidine kinase
MATSAHSLAATVPMWAPANQTTAALRAPESSLDLAIELAHEVRSPLGAMITMAELLQKGACGPLTASQRYQLELLLQAAKGISRVTTDIIDTAKASGQGAEPVAAFDVNDVLGAVSDLVQPMVESAGVKLIVRNHVRRVCMGRRVAITRVMLNLATNALKHTNSGVVEFGARMLNATRVEFFVRDTGGGLTPFAIDRFRNPPTHNDRWKRANSGLGLAISRRLLQSMGSSLDVESRAGEGCRFSFELVLRDRP